MTIKLIQQILQAARVPPEEKYMELVEAYPDLVQRVPQHLIASYLSITRLKNAVAKKT